MTDLPFEDEYFGMWLKSTRDAMAITDLQGNVLFSNLISDEFQLSEVATRGEVE